jgi:CheY-like chemotaxis protein
MNLELIKLVRDYGDLTDVQIDDASNHMDQHGLDFASAVFELGLLPEARCLEFLRLATGISVVSLDSWTPNEEASLIVSESLARSCNALPLHVFRTTLVVAVGEQNIDEVNAILRENTGLNIRAQLGLSCLVQKHLNTLYTKAPSGGRASLNRVGPLITANHDQVLMSGHDAQSSAVRSVVAVLECDSTSITDYGITFKHMPVETEYFSEGSQLLRFVESAPVDIIILGNTKFGLNALEVCRILKSEPTTQRIPIVLVTHSIKEREWQKHPRARLADEFLEKPFDVMDLTVKVEKHLEFSPQWFDVSINEDSMDSSLSNSGTSTPKFQQVAGEHLPSEPLACLTFSKALEAQGSTFQALEWLEKAVLLDGEDFKLRRELAEFYERHGYQTLALDAWQNAMMTDCTPEQAEFSKRAVRRLKA